MASRKGVVWVSNLLKTTTLRNPLSSSSSSNNNNNMRLFSLVAGGTGGGDQISNHTAKWMQDTSKKSPMELINEVPPIKVEGRIVACEGDNNPALGHPIEFICLDLKEPAICKYCGLRYVQDHHH
ncbi:hypothetical protein AQUCO_00500581v1 [Aquilegia coerulea]|uniref:Zinc finger CHCC-type domain-containing protein n=1 Tax=Aquilegia coerulea TaxID=218851 RepID=A0A2G5ESK5_AQUCA|nr:hypothetical protein AQUCO_00500581v1 [Aquilegia coerulea]